MMNETKAPAGPSGPLRQVYNQEPFVTAPYIRKDRNTKMARGVICPVTGPSGVPMAIKHNLGRKIQGMICILNGANGELPPPQFILVLPASNNTAMKSTVQANATCTNALLWVF